MKVDAPPVELVTLSDSLTSPVLKPKLKSGAAGGSTKVVCLDSDTDSDGSFVHTLGVTLEAYNTGISGALSDECKMQNDNWLGLHKCLKHSKCWGASHCLYLEQDMEIDIKGSLSGIKQSDQLFKFSSDMTKKSAQGVECTIGSQGLLVVDAKPNVDHTHLQPCDGSANVAMCGSYSPLSSPDQAFCSGDSYSDNATRFSTSPCAKVRNTSLSPIKTASVDLPQNYSVYFSSPSKELVDCSSPAWDDHLKGIISKLETSKVVARIDMSSKNIREQDRRRDYSDHESDGTKYRDYLFLKNKLRKCASGDTTATGNRKNKHKSLEKSTKGGSTVADQQGVTTIGKIVGLPRTSAINIYNFTDTLDLQTESFTGKVKQTKDREEREARKQQLKAEREILRKQKQEEKKRLQELKKRRCEEEKKRKEELKAEAVERRKVEKEKEKWEKGKFALQNITALVDTLILEGGLIGGHLLTRFAEKGFKYHLVQNPVKKTVLWQMKLPPKELLIGSQEDCLSQDSQELKTSKNLGPQLSLESVDVSYVLIVLEANEFLEMITEETLDEHIRTLQKFYPGFTLCYLINKLMWSLQRREQKQYKTPGDNWTRPPVEQILAKLATSYDGVHSRLCVDEAEVSEHIVGLTRSLAECPFKRKLTHFTLSANGDHLVKNDPNNDVIKQDVWLKALVALPKVSGSCAIAIAKKYPSMSALFEAYLDPFKTVHEKEHLLQDLVKEGLLGGDHNRRIGPACSRRIFRILMAEQGNLHTDDVEEGADAFRD